MTWPREDYIRWIEWRLRELERGKPCTAPLTAQDCRIWLAHERDKKSLAEIARAEYPRYWDVSRGKRGNQQVISLVRRTVERVEKYLTSPNRRRRRSEEKDLADVILAASYGGLPIVLKTPSSPDAVAKRVRSKPQRRKKTDEGESG